VPLHRFVVCHLSFVINHSPARFENDDEDENEGAIGYWLLDIGYSPGRA
jgi:hypothetical protein